MLDQLIVATSLVTAMLIENGVALVTSRLSTERLPVPGAWRNPKLVMLIGGAESVAEATPRKGDWGFPTTTVDVALLKS